MRKIIVAIIFTVIAALLRDAFRYSDFAIVFALLFIGAFIYLIAAVIGFVRKSVTSDSQKLKSNLVNTNTTRAANNNVVTQPVNNNSFFKKYWFQGFLIIAAIVFFAKEWLGKISFEGLLFIDNLVKFSDAFPPFLGWGLLGLLFGSIYGSVVAWKKYKLSAAINLLPIGVFILCIIIFLLVNKPPHSQPDITVHTTQTMYAYTLASIESSNEKFDNNLIYKTDYLTDNNNNTSWITDITKVFSNKEIVFTFNNIQSYAEKNLQCIGFRVKNGYNKSPQLWTNFARAKNCLIGNNRVLISEVTFYDNADYQEIKIKPIDIHTNDRISIKISSVYPGKKYANRVAITELIPIVQYENF